ncbi:MAG: hypothetical protein ACYC8T_27455 [Myxococcaceae bacterium]
MNAMTTWTLVGCAALGVAACASPEPQGLREADEGTGAKVMFDVAERPLPNIPLPNDFATRFDPSSPTKRRLNASLEAPSKWERATRASLDALDGWGTYSPITLSFDKPLDVEVIYRRHQGDDYRFTDDAVYLLDVTPDSPDFCKPVPLDMGEGNFPLTLERRDYYPNDPHNADDQLVFEEHEEDVNGNGSLDPGEDLDMDGVLDHPNTRHPDSGRFQTMGFYERETNTLIMRPVMPLRENTTYAAVITRRLLDEDGRPVRSPFRYINHTAQTKALAPLEGCLGGVNVGLEEVAFTWTFSTQSITRDFRVIRDGLYGLGPMSRLADQYPAKLTKLYKLRDAAGGVVNVQIVPGDVFLAAARDVMPALLGGGSADASTQAILDNSKFIDFHVVASFESPQFFPRTDKDLEAPADDKYKDQTRQGAVLPLYEQTWRLDPVTGDAFTRSETITFWLTVPKNRTGPAPVAILGHGYTGAKIDPIVYGGFFARQGIATVGVECVSHGIGLEPVELELARGLFSSKGLEGMYKALLLGRAFDQNGDGVADSGADFWTSYMPHTRDVVKQSAVDYMRLVQVIKSFDGQRQWEFDVNHDGAPDLAGDFDGDGKVDVGGGSNVSFTGGSLGGIMGAMVGGLEPHVQVVVPVSGAGGLGDVGVRSIQGGVAEAVNLRMMGPLLVTLKNTDGKLDVWQYLPDLNDLGKVKLGPLDYTPEDGDTAIARNLTTGEYRCARVLPGGLLRAAVSSDQGDLLRLEIYGGALPPQPREGCRVPEETQPLAVFESFAVDGKFQGKAFAAGDALTALGDGFGLRRQSPEMRRMMGIAQTILDSGDPINFAPFFESRLLHYGTGEEVRTRAVIMNTIGDMNVPMATGAALSRAAGHIELYKKDPRYGKTPNRVLIDTGAIEAVERTGRYLNSAGRPVLMDLEHFSSIVPVDDGFDVPRLNPPLRLVKPSSRLGGYSGSLFPMVVPTGRHGFDTPDPDAAWDLGSFLFNMLGRYLVTNGRELSMDRCAVDSSCEWIPPMLP